MMNLGSIDISFDAHNPNILDGGSHSARVYFEIYPEIVDKKLNIPTKIGDEIAYFLVFGEDEETTEEKIAFFFEVNGDEFVIYNGGYYARMIPLSVLPENLKENLTWFDDKGLLCEYGDTIHYSVHGTIADFEYDLIFELNESGFYSRRSIIEWAIEGQNNNWEKIKEDYGTPPRVNRWCKE